MTAKQKLRAIAGEWLDKSLDHKTIEEIIGRDAKPFHTLKKPEFKEQLAPAPPRKLFQYLCQLYENTHAPKS